MDIAKRVALTGLAFAGATALAMSAATPASADLKPRPAGHSDSGDQVGTGGGGGGNFNPYQPYQPLMIFFDHL